MWLTVVKAPTPLTSAVVDTILRIILADIFLGMALLTIIKMWIIATFRMILTDMLVAPTTCMVEVIWKRTVVYLFAPVVYRV
jgi:hypothetical protein